MLVERDPYLVLQVSRSDAWPGIRTAYRTLARRFHADGSTPDKDRMVELNGAYARLELEHGRPRDEASQGAPVGPGVPVGPGHPMVPAVPREGSLLGRMMREQRMDTPVVDFGQYAGWRIAEIAECDRRYLRWLSRHSSGFRYRAVIEQVLGPDPDIGRRAALLR